MKKVIPLIISLLLAIAVQAQTLNVVVGSVTYQFPAEQAGEMTYADGTTLTILNKAFTLSDITKMYIDDATVTDNQVGVVYSGTSAAVTVAGNVAQYITASVSGAHVNIEQSTDLAQEITYKLSGTSTDGEFYMSGSYKATLELNGLTLTNSTPVSSGAAIHIQNGKRINIKVVEGTTNTLTDAASGSQKGCLYVKGHAEFKQKGTLNVYGNVKHAIKAGEYITVKNATINVKSAAGDGINCAQFFAMESGKVSISGTSDDGIQCDLEGTESTGETTDHEDEDSGNIYIAGGTLTIDVTATAAKGIKCEGDMQISGGSITVTTSGSGEWDSTDQETKAAACMSADGSISISGGELNLTSTGSGGKGIKCDDTLIISDGTVTVKTTGGLYYNNGTTENTNYTGDTDRISSSYYSSPKGIKAGVKTESTTNGKTTYSYSGGIVISGGTINVTTAGHNGEGIESKNTLKMTDGYVYCDTYDDAVNSASDMTISGGYVMAVASNNDGLDANGNMTVSGGNIFAVSASGAEVALDAAEGKTLSITGGNLVAVGGLERGASVSGSVYQASSYSKGTWYALYNGSSSVAFAFKVPSNSSMGTPMAVYTTGTTSLKSGVTGSGTSFWNGNGYSSCSGGSKVTLSSYSSSSGGRTPGGGGPGGN